MAVKKIIVFCCLLALTGCSAVGPEYTSPKIEMADQWHNAAREEMRADLSLGQWWTSLNDAVLSSLIADALENNPDVLVARSRVLQARMERIVTRSLSYPSLNSSAAGSRSSTKSGDTGGTESDAFSVGFDASWEIDLFGGVRRAVEASQADYEASIEEMRDTLVSLVAEVAKGYVDVRAYQLRLEVAREQIASQEETLSLLVALSDAGRGDELAISQARYTLESARASLPDLDSAREQSMNSLAILTGKAAGSLRDALQTAQPIPQVDTALAIGIPADILRRRPDIRKAERELAAETARVGKAEAALYPSLSLKGSIGLESVDLGELVSAPRKGWSIGPTLSWPVFDAGALRNQVRIQAEQQNQALFNYRAAILTATGEVENALIAYAKEQEKQRHLQKALREAERAKEFAEMQYAAGVTDFSDVLEAQRSILSFRDQLTQSSVQIVTNVISLYKALGGGWQPLQVADADGRTPSGTTNDTGSKI